MTLLYFVLGICYIGGIVIARICYLVKLEDGCDHDKALKFSFLIWLATPILAPVLLSVFLWEFLMTFRNSPR